MAGHSKWANIQHRKKTQDTKRGKLFTRLIREITVAARLAGCDPDSNPRLRLAMDKALSSNMSKDTIERAIKRGAGDPEGQVYENIRYEGYGVGGVAILVECLTDNRNRTVAEVRFVFNKHGGNLGETGSVAYLFKQYGVLNFTHINEDALLEVALEAGAYDVVSAQGNAEVLTAPEELLIVKEAVIQAKFIPQSFGVEMRPESYLEPNEDTSIRLVKLLDTLEELDDVQSVYCNADLRDVALAE